MTGNVEDIIKNKKYFELSSEELSAVSEYAKTEEEYEDMKWFLMNVGEAMQGAKIEASADLEGRVMETLTASKRKKGAWMNSATVFLFPQDKRFYKKPAFQMFAAAAIIVLGIFILDPFGGMKEETGLALNQTSEEEADDGVMSDSTTEAGENSTADGKIKEEKEPSRRPAAEETAEFEKGLERDPADIMTMNDESISYEWSPAEDLEEMDELRSSDLDDEVEDANNQSNNAPVGLSSSGNITTGNQGGTFRKDQQVENNAAANEGNYFSNGDLKQVDTKDLKGEKEREQSGKGKKKKNFGGGKSKRDEAMAVSDSETSKTKTIAANSNDEKDVDTRNNRGAEFDPGYVKESELLNKKNESTADQKVVLAETSIAEEKKIITEDGAGADGYADKLEKESSKPAGGLKNNSLSISDSKELKGLFYTVK